MQVAAKSGPVLLTGETGVGKTFMARQIHESSLRAKRPFVALNCGAISENLAESELFGHRKGAFTGAAEDYEGHIAAASDGTLLLDEIDLLTPAVQAKLLRVLDDRTYEPVGSVLERRFESRLIAATNRPLEQAVAEGTFRKDLLYRIRVVELKIPPLRERQKELRQLTMRFVQQLCERDQTAVPDLPEGTWNRLQQHDWPGNLRELRNALEHAMMFMRDGVLRPVDLPPLETPETSRSGSAVVVRSRARVDKRIASEGGSPLRDVRKQGERRLLLETLDRCNFNKAHAARELGISRNGLYKRLRVLGLHGSG
jgi:transcriptional regulator with PAS, ATPase and Fis domain